MSLAVASGQDGQPSESHLRFRSSRTGRCSGTARPYRAAGPRPLSRCPSPVPAGWRPTLPLQTRCRRGSFLTRQAPGHRFCILVFNAHNPVNDAGVDNLRDESRPDALILCLPGVPPDRTGELAGSTATTCTPGSVSFRISPTPVIVPRYPHRPQTRPRAPTGSGSRGPSCGGALRGLPDWRIAAA